MSAGAPSGPQFTQADQADIERRFKYHVPHGDQPQRYQEIRHYGRDYAQLLLELVPPSRERSLALRKIEETVMWANAGIARHEAGQATQTATDPTVLQGDP